MSAQQREAEAAAFAEKVFDVVRREAADVIADGHARLERGQDRGGDFVSLVPSNPAACLLTIYPDYPTLCLGKEGHCTELFGPKEQRLEELAELVRAVIDGRYAWEHRQRSRRGLFRRLTYTQLVGTFETTNGPWVFTRQGSEPPGAINHRTYAPYRTVP